VSRYASDGFQRESRGQIRSAAIASRLMRRIGSLPAWPGRNGHRFPDRESRTDSPPSSRLGSIQLENAGERFRQRVRQKPHNYAGFQFGEIGVALLAPPGIRRKLVGRGCHIVLLKDHNCQPKRRSPLTASGAYGSPYSASSLRSESLA
jgi:hypothetical protein